MKKGVSIESCMCGLPAMQMCEVRSHEAQVVACISPHEAQVGLVGMLGLTCLREAAIRAEGEILHCVDYNEKSNV